MGKNKSTSTSTSYSGSGQQWATPYAKQGVESVNSVFNQAQPGLQQLTSLTNNSIVPTLNNKFNASLSGANDANAYWRNLMSGAGSNPYLQSVINSSNAHIMDDVNSQFAGSGRYGSGAWAGNLGKALSENANNLYYQDYYNQMGRQDAAAQALQSGNNADAAQLLGAIGMGAELPYTGSNNLANNLGALFSGGTDTSKSVQKGPGLLGGLIGAAGQIGAAFAGGSDRRLKKDIVLIATRPDGLNVYEWTYKCGDKRYQGFMADEVKALYPQAYIDNFDGKGHAGVNYAYIPAAMAEAA